MVESKENEVKVPQSSNKKIFIFTFPRIFSTLVLGIVGFALFFLYNLAYEVNSVWTGIGVGVGYFAVAAGQFLLGWLSDGKYTRLGRRKPYIYVIAPIHAIAFILLLLPNLVLPNPTEFQLFLWLISFDAIFQFTYAYTTVYQSWMPEQFAVNDRPKVSQVINIFNIIGQGIQLVFTFVVLTSARERIIANPGVIPVDFLVIIFIFAALVIIFYYIGATVMPTEEYHEIKTNYWEHLKQVFRDKNYLLSTVMIGIASFAWIIMATVMLNYIEVVLKFGTIEYLIAALVLMVGVLIFVSFWRKSVEKKGKKKTLLTIFLIAMFFLPLSLIGIFPLTPPINVIFGLLFMLGIALIYAGWGLIPPIINADLAEDARKKEGELLAGLYKGFPSILLNIFQAFGTMILGLILALPPLFGVEYSFGYIIWGLICSGFLIIAYFFTKKYLTLDFEWEKS